MNILIRHSCLEYQDTTKISTTAAASAMRCLCNIHVMYEPSRHWLTKSAECKKLDNVLDSLVNGTKADNTHLFPVLRLIFFATAVDQKLAARFFESGMLDNLAQLMELIEKDGIGPDKGLDGTLINEILNVTFNISAPQQKLMNQKISEMEATKSLKKKFEK